MADRGPHPRTSTVYFGAAAHQGTGDVNQAGRDIHQHYAPDYYQHARKFSPWAIAALLLALLFWPAALPVGHLARVRIRRTGEAGLGLTTAALVIAWSMLGVTTVALLVFWQAAERAREPWTPPGGDGLGDTVHQSQPAKSTEPPRGHPIRIGTVAGPGWPEFIPGGVTVAPGSWVTWTNTMSRQCELIPTDGELPAGKGRNPIPPGGTYTITFTRPGQYGYACDGHQAGGGLISVNDQ